MNASPQLFMDDIDTPIPPINSLMSLPSTMLPAQLLETGFWWGTEFDFSEMGITNLSVDPRLLVRSSESRDAGENIEVLEDSYDRMVSEEERMSEAEEFSNLNGVESREARDVEERDDDSMTSATYYSSLSRALSTTSNTSSTRESYTTAIQRNFNG